MSIKADEITISLIRSVKPKKLFKELTASGLSIIPREKGIYYIQGFPWFCIQIIVTSELDENEHIFLKVLTDKLIKEDYISFLDYMSYCNNTERELADIVMQSFSEVNKDKIAIWKEDKNMCEAMKEIMADELLAAENNGLEKGIKKGIEKGIERGIEKGRIGTLIEMVRKNLISVSTAADMLGITEAAFTKLL